MPTQQEFQTEILNQERTIPTHVDLYNKLAIDRSFLAGRHIRITQIG